MVKVTHQGEGHIKVKVNKISRSLQILCSPCSLQAGGLHSTEMLLVCYINGLFSSNSVKLARRTEVALHTVLLCFTKIQFLAQCKFNLYRFI